MTPRSPYPQPSYPTTTASSNGSAKHEDIHDVIPSIILAILYPFQGFTPLIREPGRIDGTGILLVPTSPGLMIPFRFILSGEESPFSTILEVHKLHGARQWFQTLIQEDKGSAK
jgi:hypothetical protein